MYCDIDNIAAKEMTGGIVEYASNKDEFLQLYNYYLTHPNACTQKIKDGYTWSKLYGTNRYSAQLFIDKIHELWNK